jgi:hypothetical protein
MKRCQRTAFVGRALDTGAEQHGTVLHPLRQVPGGLLGKPELLYCEVETRAGSWKEQSPR